LIIVLDINAGLVGKYIIAHDNCLKPLINALLFYILACKQ